MSNSVVQNVHSQMYTVYTCRCTKRTRADVHYVHFKTLKRVLTPVQNVQRPCTKRTATPVQNVQRSIYIGK